MAATAQSWNSMRPGTHRIKLGVHDVADLAVDAALFIPENGVRFLPIAEADFNLDGIVDGDDLDILVLNLFETGKSFTEGDANFDGVVDVIDFNIWNLHQGASATQS